ncbi:hypothetical protein BV494_12170 [Rahnella sikkimica]|uniref:Uncharacterized protein n=1 Tax=Rahnella sikkimica TaxID=1805933 RepID=A0A2L1URR3_9GAMM|nr:hypothetical protein BV494_12170 [Rahnella sikkimica]
MLHWAQQGENAGYYKESWRHTKPFAQGILIFIYNHSKIMVNMNKVADCRFVEQNATALGI